MSWKHTERKLGIFQKAFGVPYSDEQIAEQMEKVRGEWSEATEEDALVAYLQQLGHAMTGR